MAKRKILKNLIALTAVTSASYMFTNLQSELQQTYQKIESSIKTRENPALTPRELGTGALYTAGLFGGLYLLTRKS